MLELDFVHKPYFLSVYLRFLFFRQMFMSDQR